MSNKRITDLTELTNPTTDDVFPVVDIASNTTTKVQLGNLPIPTAVTTALATKQDTLVSGTNIKTVNSTSLVGSGNVAVQETLVSGTNIKTLNSTSLLGSGNIVLTANPSGVAGAIQFSNGSAFASDASNLFWDDTNNRLGVGTDAPSTRLHILSPNDPIGGNFGTRGNLFVATSESAAINVGGTLALGGYFAGTTNIATFGKINGKKESSSSGATDGYLSFETLQNAGNALIERMRLTSTGNIGIGETAPTSRLQIKGSGTTEATTSLLVQNSAGTQRFRVQDDGTTTINGSNTQIIVGAAGTEFQSYDTTIATIYGPANQFKTLSNIPVGVGLSGYNVASAILQADSTTRGFLPPRMTTTQKNAISSPAAGLVVYDNTTNKLCCYNGSTWNDLF